MKFVIGTQTEWEAVGLVPPHTARRFSIDTPIGEQEVILQHIELTVIADSDWEQLCNIMPRGNFLAESTLMMLLPEESVDG